jgi:hypothetical protein
MDIQALEAERAKLLRRIRLIKVAYWLFLVMVIVVLSGMHRRDGQIPVFAVRYYVSVGIPILVISIWQASLRIRLQNIEAGLDRQKGESLSTR